MNKGKLFFLSLLAICMGLFSCGKDDQIVVNDEVNENQTNNKDNQENSNNGDSRENGENENNNLDHEKPQEQNNNNDENIPTNKKERMYYFLNKFFKSVESRNLTLTETYESKTAAAGNQTIVTRKYFGEDAFTSSLHNYIRTSQGVYTFDFVDGEVNLNTLITPNTNLSIYESFAENIFKLSDFDINDFELNGDETQFLTYNEDILKLFFPICTVTRFHYEYVNRETASVGISFDDDGTPNIYTSFALILPQLDTFLETDFYSSSFKITDVGTTRDEKIDNFLNNPRLKETPTDYPLRNRLDKAFEKMPSIPFVDGFGYGLGVTENDGEFYYKDLTADPKVITNLNNALKESERTLDETESIIDVDYQGYNTYVYTAPLYMHGNIIPNADILLEFHYVPYEQLREEDKALYTNGIFEMMLTAIERLPTITNRSDINSYLKTNLGGNYFNFPDWGDNECKFYDITSTYEGTGLDQYYLFAGRLIIFGKTKDEALAYLNKIKKQLNNTTSPIWESYYKKEYDELNVDNPDAEPFVEPSDSLFYTATIGKQDDRNIYLTIEGYYDDNENFTIEIRKQLQVLDSDFVN